MLASGSERVNTVTDWELELPNPNTFWHLKQTRLLLFFLVVFMGSEKYPDENAFDAFIKKHGGSDNASTDCERVC